MKRFPMPEIQHGGVNVTPLIDIVMCLIIFFMLVAKIGVDSGVDKNIDIPTSILGTDIRDMGNTLTLNVTNGPTGVPDAQPIVTAMLLGGQMQELKLRAIIAGKIMFPLRDVLLRYREGDAVHGLAPNADFKVIIRGDKSLAYQFLSQVLVECNQAHVRTFAFDTKKPS
ncbi:MAG: biopolymer transporter ExbD [Tepidisphaeraceae bacterium]|jgi:biopolymer transport protein ExbD